MARICVFSGSSEGRLPAYRQMAESLGHEIAARGFGLVYGGASGGLMGATADAALAAGGEAIGVIPRALFKREIAHAGLTRLYEVTSMHERKAKMAELADAFIALPGGFGTFDELFEIITWAQLGIHNKPIGLLDVADYYSPLLAMVKRAVEEGFVPQPNLEIIHYAQDPGLLVDELLAAELHSEVVGTSGLV
ncbi:MAG: TIGR00730 family Rossman fold protein [Ktedonobacterales bacterium]